MLVVKKDLRKTKMEDVDVPGQNKLFINKNLCPSYKVLWSISFYGQKFEIRTSLMVDTFCKEN